jgi:hypothetical protein
MRRASVTTTFRPMAFSLATCEAMLPDSQAMTRSGRSAATALQVDLLVAADLPDLLRFFRVVAELDRADDAVAGADGEQVLRDVRRQADDAPRRLGEVRCRLGVRQRGEQGDEQKQREAHCDAGERR